MEKSSLIYSLLFHLIVLFILIVSFDRTVSHPILQSSEKPVKIMQAVALNQQEVLQKVEALKIKADMQKQAEAARIQQLQTQAALAKHQEALAQEHVSELKRSQEALEKSRALENERLLQLKAEARKQQETIAKQKIESKKIEEKKLADIHHQQVAVQRLKEQLAIQNLKKQLAANKLQQEAAKKKQQEQVITARMQGEVDKYKALIVQSIGRYWMVPKNSDKTLYCQLLIRLAPGGVVLSVNLMKSSGNEALDRSAQKAVLKASPLPVPQDPHLFDQFREFVLKVRPEEVLSA